MRPFIYTALGVVLLGGGLALAFLGGSESTERREPAVTEQPGAPGTVKGQRPVPSVDRDATLPPQEEVECVSPEPVGPVRHEGPLRVHGQVTTLEGEPLQNVLIRQFGETKRETRSGEDGTFTLVLLLNRQRTHLTFNLKGYREAHRTIHRDEVAAVTQWQVNVQLQSVELSAPVAGVLRTIERLPVEGESVHLRSASLKVSLTSVSDQDGHFAFPEVPPGKDYRLRVRVKGNFEDFSMSSMEVPADGAELEVILAPLVTARISGQMVGIEGNPVPRLALWLSNTKALGKSFQITGDDVGYFEADNVPEGNLVFQTRTYPRFTVRQVEFLPEVESHVRLVIDQGLHEVSGTAIDVAGAPLPAVRVELFWHYFEHGVRSSSHRKTTTDELGHFAFTQVGRGPHKLMVSAPGYLSAQLNHDVGSGERLPPLQLTTRGPAGK